ncbi:MAG: CBS domain-containing protein [Pirellulaceae bacterium]|nr:CBS domain-containing protein [Pirellulaceae bacterium]
MKTRSSVSDTGVMRILGDFASAGELDDGTTRQCSSCGATYPSYVPSCYSCNIELGAPVQRSDDSESIDFQAVQPFPFQDVGVRKVMRPRKEISYLDLNTTRDEILRRARTTIHTRYPVCDGSLEELIGLVHIEDVVLADETEFDIQKIIRPLELLPESMPVSEVLGQLQKSGEPIALVVDEYGTVIGMVTVKDVLLKLDKNT